MLEIQYIDYVETETIDIIVDLYNEEQLDYQQASIELQMLGCSREEVIILLTDKED